MPLQLSFPGQPHQLVSHLYLMDLITQIMQLQFDVGLNLQKHQIKIATNDLRHQLSVRVSAHLRNILRGNQ